MFWYNVCDCHAIIKGNFTYLLTYLLNASYSDNITVYVVIFQLLLSHPHNVECVSSFSDETRQQWNRVMVIVKKTHAKVFGLS